MHQKRAKSMDYQRFEPAIYFGSTFHNLSENSLYKRVFGHFLPFFVIF